MILGALSCVRYYLEDSSIFILKIEGTILGCIARNISEVGLPYLSSFNIFFKSRPISPLLQDVLRHTESTLRGIPELAFRTGSEPGLPAPTSQIGPTTLRPLPMYETKNSLTASVC